MNHRTNVARRKSSLLDCFGCCFGDDTVDNDLTPLTRGHARDEPGDGLRGRINATPNQSLGMDLARSQQARRSLYATLGHMHDFNIEDTDVRLAKWPVQTHPRFRLVHRATSKTIVLVTDGLSDPFDDMDAADANVNGFGLELYVETPVSDISLDVTEIKSSWQYKLLSTVSNLAVSHGGIRQIIDSLGVLSTEADDVAESIDPDVNRAFVSSDNRVGALLGLSDDRPAAAIPSFISDMPLSTVKLVNVKLIQLTELAVIVNRGAEGRAHLANLFSGDKEKTVSSLRRDPVI
jgi:hypothetical protein